MAHFLTSFGSVPRRQISKQKYDMCLGADYVDMNNARPPLLSRSLEGEVELLYFLLFLEEGWNLFVLPS